MEDLIKQIDVEFSKLAISNDIQPVFALFNDDKPLCVVSAAEHFGPDVDRDEAVRDLTNFVRKEARRVGANRCVFVSEQWATRVYVPSGEAAMISVKRHLEQNGKPSASPDREEILTYTAEEVVPDQVVANRMIAIRKIITKGKRRQLGPLKVETRNLNGGPMDGISRQTGFGIFTGK